MVDSFIKQTMNDEEREKNCKNYEETTDGLIEEWLEDENKDGSAEGIENGEIDGLRKEIKRMFRSCIGQEDTSHNDSDDSNT